jgi:hypothetical protein
VFCYPAKPDEANPLFTPSRRKTFNKTVKGAGDFFVRDARLDDLPLCPGTWRTYGFNLRAIWEFGSEERGRVRDKEVDREMSNRDFFGR